MKFRNSGERKLEPGDNVGNLEEFQEGRYLCVLVLDCL